MSSLAVTRLAPRAPERGTLIAVPGLMESSECMLPTLNHWAGTGLSVVAIDPPGHGQSERWTPTPTDRHTGDIIVEAILATIEEAVPLRSPVVLFGHSAGGGAAAEVAVRLRRHVGAVILEDPFWRLPVNQFQDESVAKQAGEELRRIQALSELERLAEIRAERPDWPEDELAAWSRAKGDMDATLVDDGHVIPARGWPTLVAQLVGAAIPVQVLTGTIRIGMTANHRAILRGLGAEVVVVRGASHFVRRDDRERFHALTDRFLDQHVPAQVRAGTATERAGSETLQTPMDLRLSQRLSNDPGGITWPK